MLCTRSYRPKFFAPDHPLHPDFVPDPVKRRNFNVGVGIIVVFGTAVALLPVIIAVSLRELFDWSKVWLPLAIAFIFVGAIPFYIYFLTKVGNAWKRYASWVYQNAESNSVSAQRLNLGKQLVTRITYPNGHTELVFGKYYGYDYSRLKKLDTPQTITMRRDRTVRPAVVILELEDGRRIWCTSTPSP